MSSKTICETCIRNCNKIDRYRGEACKDYKKKEKDKELHKNSTPDSLARTGAI